MANKLRCEVCGGALQSGDVLGGGGEDFVHATCDRRRTDRPAMPPTCVVCNRLIDSTDGTARLDGRLVHGACYVRARSARDASSATAAPSAGIFRRLARRLTGR